ncbi:hypothetical protein HDV00_003843 [Rhizophlyctis rosea]|nr:hypothetical protein HDV00_003843 [Rhizophlyctis rosea]
MAQPVDQVVDVVRALHDYTTTEPTCLSFRKEDLLYVYIKDKSGWWDGQVGTRRGWFPSNYVEPAPEYYQAVFTPSPTPQVLETGNSKILKAAQPTNVKLQLDSLTQTLSQLLEEAQRMENDPLIKSPRMQAANGAVPDKDTPTEAKSTILDLPRGEAILNGEGTNGNHADENEKDKRAELPPFWGRKTTPQGEVYYYNTETNQTTYSLDEVMKAGKTKRRSLLVLETIKEPTSPTTGLETVHEAESPPMAAPTPLSQATSPNSNQPSAPPRTASSPAGNWIPGPQSLIGTNTQPTWEVLINNILRAISNLNHSAKTEHKARYLSQTHLVVRAIRDMLSASRTTSPDSPVMQRNKSLRNYHQHIMSSLSKLVLAAKVASGIWPPPDAVNKMRYQAGQVLLSIRHFVAIAQDVPLELHPIDSAETVDDFDLKGAELSDVELVARVDAHSDTIVAGLARLVGLIKSDRKVTGPLIDQARACVTEIGQLMSLVEDISLPPSSPTSTLDALSAYASALTSEATDTGSMILSDFSFRKESLYIAVNDLITAARTSMDEFAPANALGAIIESATAVLQAVEDMVLAMKVAVDQRALMEQRVLQDEADRVDGRGGAAFGDGKGRQKEAPELRQLQRRAMSLNFLGEGMDRSASSASLPNSSIPGYPPSSHGSMSMTSLNDVAEPRSPYFASQGGGGRRPSVESRGTMSSAGEQYPRGTLNSSVEHFGFVNAADEYHYKQSRSGSQPELMSPRDNMVPGSRVSTGSGSMKSAGYPLPHTPSQPELSNRSASPTAMSATMGTLPSVKRTSVSSGHSGGPPSVKSFDAVKYSMNAKTHSTGSMEMANTTKLSKFFGEESSKLSMPAYESANKTWYLGHDYTPDELSLNMEGQVNGGTFSALVERLTQHDAPADTSFTIPFLMMFHRFATSEDLFEALAYRYTIRPPPQLSQEDLKHWKEKKQTPIRLRVVNSFRAWLESHWIDEFDDPVLDRIQKFAKDVILISQPALAGRLLEAVNKKVNGVLSTPTQTSPARKDTHMNYPPPTPVIPKHGFGKRSMDNFLDVDPLEIARQLTIMESRVFLRISPGELVGQEWTKKDSRISGNVRAMMGLSTRITGWVACMIVSEVDVRRRYNLLKHFIKIGDKLLALHNYNTLMAIMSALNSSTISRLKRTWELISGKQKVLLETLRNATDHSRNYADYRAKLRRVQSPCLPFLGLYLTDLTFTEDGNPPFRNNNRLINFDKYVKICRIIQEVQRFQIPYNLAEVHDLQDWLSNMIDGGLHGNGPIDAQELYRISLSLEPKESEMDEATREIENKVRMLEKAGFL